MQWLHVDFKQEGWDQGTRAQTLFHIYSNLEQAVEKGEPLHPNASHFESLQLI